MRYKVKTIAVAGRNCVYKFGDLVEKSKLLNFDKDLKNGGIEPVISKKTATKKSTETAKK